MDGRIKHLAVAGILLAAALLACGFPAGENPPSAQRTMLAATVFLMQTEVSTLQTPPPSDTATFMPVPTDTGTASPVPTPQNPLVVQNTLCWLGPGPGFQVSSSVHAGTRVILLGQGSVPGWWVIEGPVYHDPCWMPQQDLQIDVGYDFHELQIFYPPPTARPTKTPKI
ncbi:MAG TPA: hypothetical protein VLX61_05525 [Anaerolineales bacterium]|nr:hypothetical protein [Anaerolineales bacterium]